MGKVVKTYMLLVTVILIGSARSCTYLGYARAELVYRLIGK